MMGPNLPDGTVPAYFLAPSASTMANSSAITPISATSSDKDPPNSGRLNPNFRLSTALATVASHHQQNHHQLGHHRSDWASATPQQNLQSFHLLPNANKPGTESTMMTATKFEPGTHIPGAPSSMLSLGPSSSSSASASLIPSASSSASASIPSNFSAYWPDWSLAAAAMSRSAGLCADSAQLGQLGTSSPSSYYGQMAAAAVSAASSAGGTVWYPQNAYDHYPFRYPFSNTLNGYLGSYGTNGAYGSPADYYGASFPGASHYAAAALSSTFDVKKAEQQLPYFPMAATYNGAQQAAYSNLMANTQQDHLQTTGSELDDTSPTIGGSGGGRVHGRDQQTPTAPPAAPGGSYCGESGGIATLVTTVAKKGARTEKSSGASSSNASKRSKKKRAVQAAAATAGARGRSPAEPNNSALVFVWELEDLCSVLSPSQQHCAALDCLLSTMLHQLLQCGFQLEHQEEYEQANVEDAVTDEVWERASAAGAAGQGPAKGETNEGGEGGRGGGGAEAEAAGAATTPQRQAGMTASAASGSGIASGNPQQPPNNVMNEGVKRLADKYRHIRDTYERWGRQQKLGEWLAQHCGIPTEMQRQLEEHLQFAQIELFRRCLRVVAERSPLIPNRCTNVVLSSNEKYGVAAAMGRLMLCRMSEFVPAENVYCCARMGREMALVRLANRFQKKHIMLITSNEDTRQLAKKEGLPCWPLNNDQSIVNFRPALDILLGDLGMPRIPAAMPSFGAMAEEKAQNGGAGTALVGGGVAGMVGSTAAAGTGGFLTVRG